MILMQCRAVGEFGDGLTGVCSHQNEVCTRLEHAQPRLDHQKHLLVRCTKLWTVPLLVMSSCARKKKKAENVAFENVIEAQIEAATVEEPDLFFNSVCAVAKKRRQSHLENSIFPRHGLSVRCERGSTVALPSCLSPRTTLVAVKHEDGRDDHCNIDRVRFRSFDWTA